MTTTSIQPTEEREGRPAATFPTTTTEPNTPAPELWPGLDPCAKCGTAIVARSLVLQVEQDGITRNICAKCTAGPALRQ